MSHERLLLACLFLTLALTGCANAAPTMLYVSPTGNDAANGRAAVSKGPNGPLATLAGARDLVRKMKQAGQFPAGGVIIEAQPGVYEMSASLDLTADDSGSENAPIIYRAKQGAEVRLVGGKQVTNWQPVTDPAALDRLDPAARGKVYQADLKALGITDLGDVIAGGKRLEVFFQDKPMTLSRWPNEGFVRIKDLVGGAPHKIHGIPGDKIGKFVYEGDRPERWTKEKDIWLHGYWFWDWSDQRQKIESIDTQNKVISLTPPYHGYGYRKNQWYYAFNALCELDTPGEWYLDRETSTLYFWPPAPITKAKTLVSVIPALINTVNTNHITFQGFTIEATRSTPVNVGGGTGVKVVACTIRNTGGSAVSMSGTNNGVIGCDVYETSSGGIHLTGGDRNKLIPAGLYAENNHVHHYARWNRVYNPGITLHGVGNRASHNLIDNAPHMAMGFGGNNHLIEYNEIHSVCYESNDAGAIYTGRNWSMVGTKIVNNYLHHINGFEGRGCVGVYLDDQFGGTNIDNNLFYNVTRAAMIGGGRNCTIDNNIFVDCVPATHVDARGLGWAAGGNPGMVKSLTDLPYKESPWKEAYPWLLTLLDDDPMAPKHNVISRNICVGGRWGDFEGKAKPLITFTDNLLDQDPQFIKSVRVADEKTPPLATDFALKPSSPAFALGFKALPLTKMGLDPKLPRASWPVKSEVRPMVAPPPTAPKAQRTNPVTLKVARRAANITIDGTVTPAEWPGAGVAVEQGLTGQKVSPPSQAWVQWDDQALYVALDNSVNPKFPIRPGNAWGQDDAVEIAIRNPATKDAPILVLRGFPSGHFESTDEAGAPAAAAKKAAENVQYKAKVVDDKKWTNEWRIPWASLGIDPAKAGKLQFNLSARKSADELWIEWQGTSASTWEVSNAGLLELVK